MNEDWELEILEQRTREIEAGTAEFIDMKTARELYYARRGRGPESEQVEYSEAMDIRTQLAEMTAEEKLDLMEQLWDSLTASGKDWEPPDWHMADLAEREKRVEAGTNELLDLDTAREELKRRREP